MHMLSLHDGEEGLFGTRFAGTYFPFGGFHGHVHHVVPWKAAVKHCSSGALRLVATGRLDAELALAASAEQPQMI